MGKLDGKIALITGGSEGIGLATARQFIVEGAAHVFITGRRQQALDDAIKMIGDNNVTAVQGDVSNSTDLDKLYSLIQEKAGRLDILFANAEIINDYNKDCVIKNPYYHIKIGNDLLINDSLFNENYEDAMKHFDRAIELDEKHTAGAFCGKGWLLLR
ncbi:unnamed protein product, partial [Rotaria sp. Silwood2]